MRVIRRREEEEEVLGQVMSREVLEEAANLLQKLPPRTKNRIKRRLCERGIFE